MKFLLILTIMSANLESVSVTTAQFATEDKCLKAATTWVSTAGRATPALSAICVKTGAGEEE